MKKRNERGDVTVIGLAMFLAIAPLIHIGNDVSAHIIAEQGPRPPMIVPNVPGFQWHHSESVKNRKQFLENHTLINGRWVSR